MDKPLNLVSGNGYNPVAASGHNPQGQGGQSDFLFTISSRLLVTLGAEISKPFNLTTPALGCHWPAVGVFQQTCPPWGHFYCLFSPPYCPDTLGQVRIVTQAQARMPRLGCCCSGGTLRSYHPPQNTQV